MSLIKFFKRIFGIKQPESREVLKRKQYERIGRIVAHQALHDRNFNRAITRSPFYGQLLEAIGKHPKQQKASQIVRTFKLFRKS